MTETRSLSRFASIANAAFNSMTANSTAVTSMTIGGVAMNANGVASNTYTIGTAAYFVANGNLGVGTSSPTSTLDVNGNIAVTGTARRITADMSSANAAVRFAFQSSTTNGDTGVYVLPNGTGTVSAVQLFANSNPANTSMGVFATSASEVQVISTRTGTATLLPMTFAAGGSERMRIDSSGRVGIGTSSPAGRLHARFDAGASDGHTSRYIFQSTDQRLTLRTYWEAGVAQHAAIQSSTDAGTAQSLLLNPDGGNVGIGTSSPGARLDVVGGYIRNRFTDGSMARLTLENSNRIWTISNYGTQFGPNGSFNIADETAGAVRMQIDSAGRVTMPSQPAFTAFGGGIVSVSVTNYVLALSGTLTNRGSHYNTSTFRFTAPVAGMYLFAHRVTWASSGTGIAVFLAVNGSAVGGSSAYTEVFGYTSAGGYDTTSAAITVLQLNANDFVDLRSVIYNSSSQSLDLTRCSLTGYLIG